MLFTISIRTFLFASIGVALCLKFIIYHFIAKSDESFYLIWFHFSDSYYRRMIRVNDLLSNFL